MARTRITLDNSVEEIDFQRGTRTRGWQKKKGKREKKGKEKKKDSLLRARDDVVVGTGEGAPPLAGNKYFFA